MPPPHANARLGAASAPPPTVAQLLEHRPFVRRLARRLVTDGHEADDVVQQSWLRVLRYPPSHGGAVRAWLTNVVRSTAISAYRARDRSIRAPRPSADTTSPPPEEILGHEQLERDLARAIDQLSPPYATAIRLRFYDGLPPRKIAERLDVPVATVNSRIQRGLKRMRTSLDTSRGGQRSWGVALLAFAGLRRRTSLAPSLTVAVAGVAAIVGTVHVTGRKVPRPSDPTVSVAAASRAPSGDDRLSPRVDLREPVPDPTPDAESSGIVVPPDEEGSTEPVEAVTVSGRVVYRDGEPVPGAEIWTYPPFRRDGGSRIAMSDEDGGFRVGGLDPRAWIGARVAGMRPSRLSLAGSVSAGEPLVLAIRPPNRLEGFVRDDSGRPIEGATLRFVDDALVPTFDDHDGIRANPKTPVSRTDAAGRFAVPEAMLQAADVEVAKPGYRSRIVAFPRGFSREPDELTPPPVEVVLSRASAADEGADATLSGRVQDAAGRPVPGGRILARAQPVETSPLAFLLREEMSGPRAVADEEGHFALRVDPGRAYTVFLLGERGAAAPPLDVVRSGDELLLRPDRMDQGAVEGRLERRPGVPGFAVLSSQALPVPLACSLGPDDTFRFENLLPGRYSLFALVDSRIGVRTEVALAANEVVRLGTLAPGPACTLRVSVRQRDGGPLRAARALLERTPGDGYRLLRFGQRFADRAFERDGSIWFTGLAAGEYALNVRSMDSTPGVLEFEVRAGEEHHAELVLEAGFPHRVTVEAEGLSVGLLTLTLHHARGWTIAQATTSVRDGLAHMTPRLTTGHYELVVTAAGAQLARHRFEVEGPDEVTIVRLGD